MSVNIHDALFHSLRSSGFDPCLDSIHDDLPSILSRGLLTRTTLKKVLSYDKYQMIRKRNCWQGNDCVSLAFNPNNLYYVFKYPSKEHRGLLSSSAYDNFILTGNIAIILNDKILKEKEVVTNRARMNYEVQVKGDISPNYFAAIGLKEDKLVNDMIRLESVLLELMSGIKDNEFKLYGSDVSYIMELLSKYENNEIIEKYDAFSLERVKKVLDIAKKKLPIIYVTTGTEAYSKDDKMERIHHLRKVYTDFNKVKQSIWK